MDYYKWVLAFHVMAFLSWMAMLFYLPRLFVYHVEYAEKKGFVEVVKIQEYKIYTYIGLPAFWATLASGLLMIALDTQLLSSGGWIYAKFAVLIILALYSFSLEKYRLELANGTCTKSGKFFRAYNEVPTALAILIVGYVITKSFSWAFTLITLGVLAMIMDVILDGKEKK
ncbi:CopD family protein [Sulfurospirillum barnesii]|uniref:Protoporphyrinogen IX oxidase n=1 Tax=Sulfurospirillum barnesii (strain ATCC 700032 / DSM 10660 / SES-3) TaxID=760154 RepID=I3XU08_SULBS|nr:CopD family protein [Sulfurospirillum barnesii]AFL67432.1 putative membrane protein [Sulfurospirillum barnesii SES-3]